MKINLYRNKSAEQLVEKCKNILEGNGISMYHLGKGEAANLYNENNECIILNRASVPDELYYFMYKGSPNSHWVQSALFSIED